VARDLNDALDQAGKTNCKEIFIIGGGEIYRQSMELADKIYMTRVHAVLDGDTFFPEIDPNKWKIEEQHEFLKDEKHAYNFTFETWVKK
jgi:dihydrofolate reductase